MTETADISTGEWHRECSVSRLMSPAPTGGHSPSRRGGLDLDAAILYRIFRHAHDGFAYGSPQDDLNRISAQPWEGRAWPFAPEHSMPGEPRTSGSWSRQ